MKSEVLAEVVVPLLPEVVAEVVVPVQESVVAQAAESVAALVVVLARDQHMAQAQVAESVLGQAWVLEALVGPHPHRQSLHLMESAHLIRGRYINLDRQ